MHPGPYGAPGGAYAPPMPYGHNVPRYGYPGGGSQRGGCSCLRIVCGCCCCIFLTLILIVAGCTAAWFIIDPRVPKMAIDKFDVKTFNLTADDFSLKTQLEADIKSDNPNKYIEFTFGGAKDPEDNVVEIFYEKIKLCFGTVPNVHQPKKNVTHLKIDLKGDVKQEDLKGKDGEALMNKMKNNEKIPISVVTRIPVKVKMTSGLELSSDPWTVSVTATLNLQNIAPGKSPTVSDTKYKFKLLH